MKPAMKKTTAFPTTTGIVTVVWNEEKNTHTIYSIVVVKQSYMLMFWIIIMLKKSTVFIVPYPRYMSLGCVFAHSLKFNFSFSSTFLYILP